MPMKKLLVLAFACLLGNAAQAAGDIHALIMAIGQYQDANANLGGVAHDIDSARIIAQQMGVKAQNLKIYRNAELDLKGMNQAFDTLEASVADDDQVFIYYSGHGTRQIIPESNGERCAEGLITADMQGFFDSELESRLQTLGKKAAKVIVMLDACHSGGATTRTIGPRSPGFKAKSWQPKGDAAACSTPVNVVKRSIAPATRAVGRGTNNFVYIAAARDNEVSLDNEQTGGLATSALRACMEGAAQDLDDSGALSAEEIRACAQDKINQRLAASKGYLPHNITITGNSRMVLKFAPESAPPAKPPLVLASAPQASQPSPQLAAPAQVVAPPATAAPVQPLATTAQASATTVAVTPTPQATPSKPLKKFKKKRKKRRLFGTRGIDSDDEAEDSGPAAALIDLYENRDDRRLVLLETEQPTLKIGQGALQLRLKSSHAGYVYLLMIGSDDETIDLIYPNAIDQDNLIAAGQTLLLPRKGWQLEAQGPAGVDLLMAIVSDTPRDFKALGMAAAGPFASTEVKAGTTRNLQVVASGVSGKKSTYGADVLEIEEIK